MAFKIVKNLIILKKLEILEQLQQGVQENEKKKGKKHQVFRLSYDIRRCFDEMMVGQKLDYLHFNPVSGIWNLVDDFVDYPHSSAAYYELGKGNKYLTHYKEVTYEVR